MQGIVIAVHGELDLTTTPRLVDVFDLATRSTRAIIVDLCGCTFIDVDGVETLLRLEEAAAQNGVAVGIVRLPGDVATSVLASITADRLALHPDRTSALASLNIARIAAEPAEGGPDAPLAQPMGRLPFAVDVDGQFERPWLRW